jgi:hypothetical protein
MHTPPATVIRLREDRFDERARELGLTSNLACAAYLGIDRSTLGRIRKGEVLPGEKFIAACLNSKFADSFEALFELGEAS